jgi:hypothetical protein
VRHSVREAFNRIRSFFRKDPLDQELNQEIASHLETAVEENIRRGMSAEEARRQALVLCSRLRVSLPRMTTEHSGVARKRPLPKSGIRAFAHASGISRQRGAARLRCQIPAYQA